MKVSYVIEDLEHPANDEILSMAKREHEYTIEYKNRTGKLYFNAINIISIFIVYIWIIVILFILFILIIINSKCHDSSLPYHHLFIIILSSRKFNLI